ncbi:hypothetical protein [Robiginitalea sediminis]|uniref:hypothetical protein n=1 Tax=Robiginitalea sediminis TaxID=1982593 RepID=UPI000B4BA34C|nr:hypothetical protein [Robiginitalea sediminis]
MIFKWAIVFLVLNPALIRSQIAEKPFPHRDTIFLSEVVVSQIKGKNKNRVAGRVLRGKVDHFLPGFAQPYTLQFARFFPHKDTYATTPFIASIRFITRTRQETAYFRVQLYEANRQGKPGKAMLDEELTGIARKGHRWTEVSLGKRHIRFPEKGFFVGIEWSLSKANETLIFNTFEPEIGFMVLDSANHSWVLKNKAWSQINPFQGEIKRFKHRYKHLAAEVVLSNRPAD